MKPKYKEGQMVLHKLDRRCMIVITVFDLPGNYLYTCTYKTDDGKYNSARFKECELTENEDII